MHPRKRRTREHIIADQSVHYLEGFIIDEGHVAHRVHGDYGYDLFMETFDVRGYVESDLVCFQLKASETLPPTGNAYVFDVDIRDYNLWMDEPRPVILVLFDASRRKAVWICIQQYFAADSNRQPTGGQQTVRVRIPMGQIISRRAIATIRNLKRKILPAS